MQNLIANRSIVADFHSDKKIGRNRLGIIFFGTFVPPLRSPDHPRHLKKKHFFFYFFLPTCLPACLPTYLPTYYLPTYLLPTYLPTYYLPTYHYAAPTE